MTLPPLALAVLLAAVLAATAVVELCSPLPGPDFAPPIRITPAASATAADVSAAAAAWSAAILQRPLFRPDRRPLAPDAAVAVPLPRLSAIVISATGGTAIFSGDDGTAVAVGVGGMIDGYHVAAITPGEVRLTGAEGSRIVHPQFAPAVQPATVPLPNINGHLLLDNN